MLQPSKTFQVTKRFLVFPFLAFIIALFGVFSLFWLEQIIFWQIQMSSVGLLVRQE
jgi:hypothetical protein